MSILHYFVRMNEHALLLEAMVAKLELTERMDGLADRASVMRHAANRCLACNRAMDCGDWLASTESAARAPHYCRNYGLFSRLSEETAANGAQNSP